MDNMDKIFQDAVEVIEKSISDGYNEDDHLVEAALVEIRQYTNHVKVQRDKAHNMLRQLREVINFTSHI